MWGCGKDRLPHFPFGQQILSSSPCLPTPMLFLIEEMMGQASLQLVFCSSESQPVFKLLREGKAGSGSFAAWWLCGLDASS